MHNFHPGQIEMLCPPPPPPPQLKVVGGHIIFGAHPVGICVCVALFLCKWMDFDQKIHCWKAEKG